MSVVMQGEMMEKNLAESMVESLVVGQVEVLDETSVDSLVDRTEYKLVAYQSVDQVVAKMAFWKALYMVVYLVDEQVVEMAGKSEDKMVGKLVAMMVMLQAGASVGLMAKHLAVLMAVQMVEMMAVQLVVLWLEVMVFFIVVLTVVNEGCTVEFEDGFIDG